MTTFRPCVAESCSPPWVIDSAPALAHPEIVRTAIIRASQRIGLVALNFIVFSEGIDHVIAQSVRRSEEHTSELQSRPHLVCRLLLEKKNAISTLPNSVGYVTADSDRL